MVQTEPTRGWWPHLYEPLKGLGEKIADWFAPRSEASAGEDFHEITLELPGVKPEDIEVSLHDGNLQVKGEKRAERREEGRTYFFSEREYGLFQRSFRLPADADGEKVLAEHRDGILTLKVAKKSKESDGARKIEVRAG